MLDLARSFTRYATLILLSGLGFAAEPPSGIPPDVRLSLRFDAKTHFRMREYASLREWEERRLTLRSQILVAAGVDQLPHNGPLHAKRFGKQREGQYTVEKVLFESFPGYFVAGNLYLPVTTGRHPGILVPHGHWKNGRVHNTATYSVPALCANLAAQGFAAFAYDMVGYNDTRQTPHVFGATATEMLWSYSPLGLQLWNSIRALDLLVSLSEVDNTRVGVTGASGGATQTILLAAVDDRIKASAPVDMVSASFQGDDACEIAPGLRNGTNNVEIASIIAPKPMLMVSATGDWTRATPMIEFPAVTAIYRLFGHGEMVGCAHVRSPHNYNQQSREAVYAFFQRHLLNEPMGAAPHESEAADLRPEELLINRQPTLLDLGPRQLFDLWKNQMRQVNARLNLRQMRERLTGVLGFQWPHQVSASQHDAKLILEPDHSGEHVLGEWQTLSGGNVAILIDNQTLSANSIGAAAWTGLSSSAAKFRVEVFHAAVTKSPHISPPAFLTYQHSDDVNRVQDILTTIAYMKQLGRDRITLVCSTHASPWCMMAAAVSPVPVGLKLETELRPTTDEEIAKTLFIPGLQHAGGFDAVRALARDASVRAAALDLTPAIAFGSLGGVLGAR